MPDELLPGQAKRDLTTGQATLVGPLEAVVADITFGPDGILYGWSESSDDLVTIDVTTGTATVVGESNLNTFGSGLAFDVANDRLLFAGHGSNGALPTDTAAVGD